MVNLITRVDSMETLKRVITLYGDFMVKLVWRLSGVLMEKTW